MVLGIVSIAGVWFFQSQLQLDVIRMQDDVDLRLENYPIGLHMRRNKTLESNTYKKK